MVKTALKLLLVFVEFTESNAQLLIQAVVTVEQGRGEPRAQLQVAELSRAWCLLVAPWKECHLLFSSSKPFLVASKDREVQAVLLWEKEEGPCMSLGTGEVLPKRRRKHRAIFCQSLCSLLAAFQGGFRGLALWPSWSRRAGLILSSRCLQ